jgi:RNA recognition motif-containing protein
MQIKRAYTKEQSRKKIVDEKYRKVFIVGLPGDLSEEETKTHFSKFGAVQEVRIIHDKPSNTPRGFGFVLFENRKGLVNVLNDGEIQIINKKKVECRPTLLREELKRLNPKGSQSGQLSFNSLGSWSEECMTLPPEEFF